MYKNTVSTPESKVAGLCANNGNPSLQLIRSDNLGFQNIRRSRLRYTAYQRASHRQGSAKAGATSQFLSGNAARQNLAYYREEMKTIHGLLASMSVLLFAACSSSFSEDTLHKMLDEAEEVAKECAIFKREIACTKTLNRWQRLSEYIHSNETKATEHFRSHPFDMEKLKSMAASMGKV